MIWDGKGDETFQDKGYEPTTKTVFQRHGCKWHACICLKNSTKVDENRYIETTEKEELRKAFGYNLVSFGNARNHQK